VPVRALLDTCVLYAPSLRCALLQLAVRDYYLPLWSERIMGELRRNLVPKAMSETSFDSMYRDLLRSWPEAMVVDWEPLESSMKNDSKDRHVLAAAVRGRAEVLVTSNLKDFPVAACTEVGVEVLHPDAFLTRLHEEQPWGVLHAMAKHSFDLRSPPLSLGVICDHLGDRGCTAFANAMRAQLAVLPGSGPSWWHSPEDKHVGALDGDWYCVRTNPFPCGEDHCDFVAVTMTAAHRTLVWPTNDDPSLLRHAAEARECHRNPVIARYERSMGAACSYYESDAQGHPVHGLQPDPLELDPAVEN
jgi:predicted nucleic acid-binding protein